MSFTVYHTKNGVRRPIKLSIFDAFRGVPNPKPKKPKVTSDDSDLEKCSCCGKFHNSGVSSDPKTQPDAITNANQPPSTEAKKNADGLTEDDQIMIRMKTENPTRPWQEIVDVTGFTNVGMAKSRWKEIEHDKKQEAEKEAEKKESKKAKKEKKREQNARNWEKINRDREEGLKRQAELREAKIANAEGSNGAAQVADKDKGVRFAATTTATPTYNNLKSQAETYDLKKWQELASRHYDKTGIRISAAKARQLAEGI